MYKHLTENYSTTKLIPSNFGKIKHLYGSKI